MKSFTGTIRLFLFTLRRERVHGIVWLLSLMFTTVSVALTFEHLYDTETEIEALKQIILNPAITAMVGQPYGINHYATDTMMAHQMLLFTMIAVAIMNILLVARHTRADEQSGRLEHIIALPVGRIAGTLALTLYVIIINLFVTVSNALSLMAIGLEGVGSFSYGLALGTTGVFFASITALFAQFTSTSQATTGLSLFVLIGSYMLRAIGDMEAEILSKFSPFGLLLMSEVYVNNYLSPFFILLGIAVLLLVIVFFLQANREIGEGLIQVRSRKVRQKSLSNTFQFVLRLQLSLIIAWAIGLYVLGASYGSMLGDMETFLEGLSMIEKMLPDDGDGTLTEQFLGMLMSVMALIGVVPSIIIVQRLYAEEDKNQMEILLTTGTSRIKVMSHYLLVAFITSIVMLVMTVIGLYSVSIFVMDEAIPFQIYLEYSLGYLLAIWVTISLATFLIGIAPKWRNVIWIYIVYSFVVIYLGDLLELPNWLKKLTSYGYTISFPLDSSDWLTFLGLIIVSCAFIVLGIKAYQSRDLE